MAARTRTLAELEGDVLWQADRQGTALRNESARVRRAINQSIAEFREHVSDNGHPYYLTKTEGALSVGPTQPYHFGILDLSALSPAHHRVYGFDIQVNHTWYSLEPVLFQARNRYQTLDGLGRIPEAFFQFDRTTVGFAPSSASAYPYLLWYLPVHADLAVDGSTFDGLNGWEEWVTFSAVAKLLLRDRDSHLERFEAERTRLLALVLAKAPQRQRAGGIVRGGRDVLDERGHHGRRGFLDAGTSMNQPSSGEVGRVALAGPGGRLNYYAGEEEGADLVWSGGIWIKRRGWVRPDIDTTGVVDASDAIIAALATRTGVCVALPDGDIRITKEITMPHNGSALVGFSQYGTNVMCDPSGLGVGTGWITANGTINPRIGNMTIRGLSTGVPLASSDAVRLVDCFSPAIENLLVTGMYDGVHLAGCLEAKLQGQIWFREMFGVKGLYLEGKSGYAERVIGDNPYPTSPDGKAHAARQTSHAYAIGDTYTNNSMIWQVTVAGTSSSGGGPTTVPGTNVSNARTTNVTDGTATVRWVGRLMEWIYGGADVAGFTVMSCALLNGYRAFRQVGGNWWFFNHAEFDHQWADAVALTTGSGFRSTRNLWLSSVFTGNGISVGATYSGDIQMSGGRIFGVAGLGVLLQPGPTQSYFEGLNVGTCGGLGGLVAGAISGAGPKHFSFRNNRVTACGIGIAAITSDADYFHVTGNDTQGCTTGVDMSGASGINKLVTHNI